MTSLYPKTVIKITCQVLSQDGSILSTAINAMILALLDSGMLMKGTCCAVSCMISKDGDLILDPTVLELKESVSSHSFAFNLLDDGCVVIQSNGIFSTEEFDACYELCLLACKSIYNFVKAAITKKLLIERGLDAAMDLLQSRYSDSQISWKSKDKLSQKNGPHATVYLINGDKYMGEWKDNLRDGKGTHYYKKTGNQYMGEWKSDKRHGYGTLSVPEEISSKSSLKNSIFAPAESQSSKTDGSLETNKLRKIYTGSWVNDFRHGMGTFFYPDGGVYEGNWVQDMRQGWGRMTYGDGSVYEGEWHHEMRHGQGIFLLKNCDRYEGMWFDDEKEGPGKFIYLHKRQCYSGEWSRGQPRCGTITNLTAIPGHTGTLYPIPPIGLENPQAILDSQRELLHADRAKRLVG